MFCFVFFFSQNKRIQEGDNYKNTGQKFDAIVVKYAKTACEVPQNTHLPGHLSVNTQVQKCSDINK